MNTKDKTAEQILMDYLSEGTGEFLRLFHRLDEDFLPLSFRDIMIISKDLESKGLIATRLDPNFGLMAKVLIKNTNTGSLSRKVALSA